jgi:hypothetical protein
MSFLLLKTEKNHNHSHGIFNQNILTQFHNQKFLCISRNVHSYKLTHGILERFVEFHRARFDYNL